MTFPASMFGTLVSLGAQIVGARRARRRRVNATIARNEELHRLAGEVARLRRDNAMVAARNARLSVVNADLIALLDRRDGFARPYVGGVAS